MTQLKQCLVTKLDNFSDFGDARFGTVLNQCLNDILALVGAGGDLKLPEFADSTEFENANVAVAGCIFLSTTTGNIEYYVNDSWVEIDVGTLQACCDANSAAITALNNSLTTINTDINTLQGDLASHNHDGIDTPKIDVKNLDTSTAAAGDIFKADGAGGVTCEQPSGASLKVSEEGGLNVLDVECINFDTEFVTVVDAGGGQVDILMGDLTTLSDDFYGHTHGDGTTGKVLPSGIDSAGLTPANDYVLVNDGLGCAQWEIKPGAERVQARYFIANSQVIPTDTVTSLTAPWSFQVSHPAGIAVPVTLTPGQVTFTQRAIVHGKFQVSLKSSSVAPGAGSPWSVTPIVNHFDAANTLVHQSSGERHDHYIDRESEFFTAFIEPGDRLVFQVSQNAGFDRTLNVLLLTLWISEIGV